MPWFQIDTNADLTASSATLSESYYSTPGDIISLLFTVCVCVCIQIYNELVYPSSVS